MNPLSPIPLYRWDSLRKLSSFHILPIAAFVHPSVAVIDSTSSRRGWMYSGLAARSYSACVTLCSPGNESSEVY